MLCDRCSFSSYYFYFFVIIGQNGLLRCFTRVQESSVQLVVLANDVAVECLRREFVFSFVILHAASS